MFKFISFVSVVVFMMVLGGSNLLAAKDKPPLSGGIIASEILVGGIGSLGGVFLADLADSARRGNIKLGGTLGGGELSSWSRKTSVLILGGVTLGSFIGVYLLGNVVDETGSFLATLGGSILGILVGGGGCLGGCLLTGAKPAGEIANLSVVTGVFAGSSIGATIGFNLTRKYDKSDSNTRAAPIRLDLVKVRF